MADHFRDEDTARFLKSLGFPGLTVHHAVNHFNFRMAARRILVIGPMGSGKTEFSSRVWRDAQVTHKKSELIAGQTTDCDADRRNVFFIRSQLDTDRFSDYPLDALSYRGGYIRCGENIAKIRNSFELESVINDHPEVGTWIIDEASFYDERLVYVVQQQSRARGLIFIFPTLVLNFRREIFNPTSRPLLEAATDVFPLTAYCEHDECIEDSFYTYRYYLVDVSSRELPPAARKPRSTVLLCASMWRSAMIRRASTPFSSRLSPKKRSSISTPRRISSPPSSSGL